MATLTILFHCNGYTVTAALRVGAVEVFNVTSHTHLAIMMQTLMHHVHHALHGFRAHPFALSLHTVEQREFINTSSVSLHTALQEMQFTDMVLVTHSPPEILGLRVPGNVGWPDLVQIHLPFISYSSQGFAVHPIAPIYIPLHGGHLYCRLTIVNTIEDLPAEDMVINPLDVLPIVTEVQVEDMAQLANRGVHLEIGQQAQVDADGMLQAHVEETNEAHRSGITVMLCCDGYTLSTAVRIEALEGFYVPSHNHLANMMQTLMHHVHHPWHGFTAHPSVPFLHIVEQGGSINTSSLSLRPTLQEMQFADMVLVAHSPPEILGLGVPGNVGWPDLVQTHLPFISYTLRGFAAHPTPPIYVPLHGGHLYGRPTIANTIEDLPVEDMVINPQDVLPMVTEVQVEDIGQLANPTNRDVHLEGGQQAHSDADGMLQAHVEEANEVHLSGIDIDLVEFEDGFLNLDEVILPRRGPWMELYSYLE